MSLSSLLVQREVATMRQVEEALARQVIYGGDLATNLLEVASVDEEALTQVIAEGMHLAPAPPGELPVAPERAQLVPQEIAVARGIVPFKVDADVLVLAVVEPIPPELEEQLMFTLGLAIDQRAAPVVRVRQAIARLYEVPLDRRLQRLVARLSGAPTPFPSPAVTPPLGFPLTRMPERSEGAGGKADIIRLPERSEGAGGYGGAPRSLTPSIVRRQTSGGFPGTASPPVAQPPLPQSVAPDADPASAPMPPAQRRTGLLQRDVSTGVRAARRRRGPLTLDTAKHDAAEAADRDALLDLFFDFSRQYFDYAALFLVHGDIAEGRDAFGTGASRERVVGIGVPLDLPSLMSRARDDRAPIVANALANGLDAVLLADLQRPRDTEMVMVPLVVRTRTVALLLGDCGDAGIERTSVREVTNFATIVGKALERIIVRRKLGGFVAGGRSSNPPGPQLPLAAPQSVAPAARPSEPTGPPPDSPVTVPPESPRRPVARIVPASMMPPPPPTVATVRQISGPPIPREEPPDFPPQLEIAPAAALPHIDESGPVGLDQATPRAANIENVESGWLEAVNVGPASQEAGNLESAWQEVANVQSASTKHVRDSETAVAHGIPDDLDARALFDILGWETGAEEPEGPPPSSALAVPPHHPPHGHNTPSDELPSVIVDLEQELAAMVDRIVSGEADESDEGELLRQGERAMRVIMARFPGPVTFERSRIASMTNPPRASECGPLLRLVARQRRIALPFVLARISDPDPEVRGWATHLLCELPYDDAIPDALARLRDPDASTRSSAVHAIAAVAKVFPDQARDAVKALAGGSDPAGRVAALAVMARLRQAALVPDLVGALADGDDPAVAAAHDALVQVTGHDFGNDARPWLKWWEANASRHRIEWLIDALTHDVSEIRRAAAEELRAITREYFGYASDLPPRDRDRAQQRYRDWWTTEGRMRFRKR
jgi:hypothetical protein